MSQTLTISVSDSLYQQLQRAAELFHQPTETIIIHSLNHTLPPLLEEIPIEYQLDVYPLLQMSDRDLQQAMRQAFAPERWTEYERLLAKKKLQKLTTHEERQLSILRREADVIMFRRSYAAVLLKRRGYQLPSLQEMQAAS